MHLIVAEAVERLAAAGASNKQIGAQLAEAAPAAVRWVPTDVGDVQVSALDPLNLVGTLLPGEKLPRQSGARLLLRALASAP